MEKKNEQVPYVEDVHCDACGAVIQEGEIGGALTDGMWKEEDGMIQNYLDGDAEMDFCEECFNKVWAFANLLREAK